MAPGWPRQLRDGSSRSWGSSATIEAVASVVLESTLTEQNAVPLVVMSAARDPVEAINSILRRAGHPVHCTWIASLRDLGEGLTKVKPELLVHVGGVSDELQIVVNIRDQVAASVPI